MRVMRVVVKTIRALSLSLFMGVMEKSARNATFKCCSCQSKQSPETQGLSLSPFMGVMEKSARNAGLNAEMQKCRKPEFLVWDFCCNYANSIFSY